LVLLCAHVLAHFQLHERRRQHPHSFPEEVHIPLHLGLAPQLQKCHPEIVGHRVGPPFRDVGHHDENPTVAVCVNLRTYTLAGTLPHAVGEGDAWTAVRRSVIVKGVLVKRRLVPLGESGS
jgi:hypothetical protein